MQVKKEVLGGCRMPLVGDGALMDGIQVSCIEQFNWQEIQVTGITGSVVIRM